MKHSLNAQIIVNELFNPYQFHLKEITWNSIDDTFVSDVINSKEFDKWDGFDEEVPTMSIQEQWFNGSNGIGLHYEPPHLPVLINAQTGSGKNYMVTHSLRVYAKPRGRKILYVSNRVALSKQMKKELAELTNVKFHDYSDIDLDSYEETFDNVTVTTYNRLIKRFIQAQNNDEWFKQFC